MRFDPAELARTFVDVLIFLALLRVARACDGFSVQIAKLGRMLIGDAPPLPPPPRVGQRLLEGNKPTPTIALSKTPVLSRLVDKLRRKTREPPTRRVMLVTAAMFFCVGSVHGCTRDPAPPSVAGSGVTSAASSGAGGAGGCPAEAFVCCREGREVKPLCHDGARACEEGWETGQPGRCPAPEAGMGGAGASSVAASSSASSAGGGPASSSAGAGGAGGRCASCGADCCSPAEECCPSASCCPIGCCGAVLCQPLCP